MAKLPEDRPSARDTVARVQAAAAPKIARAQAKAGPAAEKAAANAGKLLGTLRDRAKTTLKEFSGAYSGDADEPAAPAADVRTRTGAAGPAESSGTQTGGTQTGGTQTGGTQTGGTQTGGTQTGGTQTGGTDAPAGHTASRAGADRPRPRPRPAKD